MPQCFPLNLDPLCAAIRWNMRLIPFLSTNSAASGRMRFRASTGRQSHPAHSSDMEYGG